VFASLAEARAVIERWRRDYNQVRPHLAHGGLTPEAAHLRSEGARPRNPDQPRRAPATIAPAGAAMNNQDSHSHCGTAGEQVRSVLHN
jgi:hypothetical protein